MDAKQKMAITGAGMVAAGLGLSIAGAALIAPAVFGWAAGYLLTSWPEEGVRAY